MDRARQGTLVERLESEIQNFDSIARPLRPTLDDLPDLDGLEVAGFTLPLNGNSGGDHIAYIHAAGTTPYMGERLEEWFRRHGGRPLGELVDSLADDLREFSPLQDDARIVIVRKTP